MRVKTKTLEKKRVVHGSFHEYRASGYQITGFYIVCDDEEDATQMMNLLNEIKESKRHKDVMHDGGFDEEIETKISNCGCENLYKLADIVCESQFVWLEKISINNNIPFTKGTFIMDKLVYVYREDHLDTEEEFITDKLV